MMMTSKVLKQIHLNGSIYIVAAQMVHFRLV